jgi:hypothetical protein
MELVTEDLSISFVWKMKVYQSLLFCGEHFELEISDFTIARLNRLFLTVVQFDNLRDWVKIETESHIKLTFLFYTKFDKVPSFWFESYVISRDFNYFCIVSSRSLILLFKSFPDKSFFTNICIKWRHIKVKINIFIWASDLDFDLSWAW